MTDTHQELSGFLLALSRFLPMSLPFKVIEAEAEGNVVRTALELAKNDTNGVVKRHNLQAVDELAELMWKYAAISKQLTRPLRKPGCEVN